MYFSLLIKETKATLLFGNLLGGVLDNRLEFNLV